MGIRERFKKGRFARWLKKVFGRNHAKIGIYGPPNSGKTTLANNITNDWILFLQRNARRMSGEEEIPAIKKPVHSSMRCKGRGIQRKKEE